MGSEKESAGVATGLPGLLTPLQPLQQAMQELFQGVLQPETTNSPAFEGLTDDVATESKADSVAAEEPEAEAEPDPKVLLEQLRGMGYGDEALLSEVIQKNESSPAPLEACVHDLTLLNEWDYMLDDLDEMGFPERDV